MITSLWSKTVNSNSKPDELIRESLSSKLVTVTKLSYSGNGGIPASDEQYYSQQEQNKFMKKHGGECVMGSDEEDSAYVAFSSLSKASPSHAAELFKFCVLKYELTKESVAIASFKHAESLVLGSEDFNSKHHNFAVINSQKDMVHGSYLVVKKDQLEILKSMAKYIVDNFEVMPYEPFLVAREFYRRIQQQIQGGGSSLLWVLSELICDVNDLEYRCQANLAPGLMHKNASEASRTIILTPRQYLPYQSIPNDTNGEEAYATKVTPRQTSNNIVFTPNFYEIVSSEDCLPTNNLCEACMKNLQGGTCRVCHKFCGCFCDSLCKTEVKDKAITKIMEYKSPLYKRNNIDFGRGEVRVDRLIPNIVHQTWFEEIGREK